MGLPITLAYSVAKRVPKCDTNEGDLRIKKVPERIGVWTTWLRGIEDRRTRLFPRSRDAARERWRERANRQWRESMRRESSAEKTFRERRRRNLDGERTGKERGG